jgi:hypothetical protein
MAAGTGRRAQQAIEVSMPESTKKTERADAPRLEPQAAKPERLEKPQVRPQWTMKAPSEPPRPAKRYEGPPQAAPYIVTPDRTHVDAYWRSRHLQLDRHDEQLSGARRYPPSKTFQPAYANDDLGGYDDVYEDQGQAHAAPRRSRRREGNYGRTGRDLAIAAGLALSLSSVTGAAVYDRASGGQIAAAIMAPFGTDATASEIPVVAAKVVATAPEPAPAKATEPAPAVVDEPSGKPIATAKLEVADASGTADEPVDLDLQATPGEAGQELELRLSGLPDKAYLTAGTQISPASWSLKPAEAEIVKLVLPGKQAGEFDLSVAAVEAKTGELVAPTKDLNVKLEAPLAPDASAEAETETVTPPSPEPQETEPQETEAAAPPPPEIREAVMPSPDVEEATPSPKLQSFATQPAERAAVPPPQVKVALSQPAAKAVIDTVATPVDALPVPSEVIPAAVETPPAEATPAPQPQGNEQARNLVSRGDHLMMLGDLAAAREFYLEALKLGAAPTTLLQVGMTYDPVVYEANKVAGLSPDARMALDYYRKADQAGVTAARDAITRLEAWSPN